MCNLFLAFAATIHLTFGEVDKLNYYHPHTSIECEMNDSMNWIGGVYYNSDYRISPYGGVQYNITKNQRLEAGLVGNYKSDPILPWIRYVNRIFFIAPSVVSNTTDFYLTPDLLYESKTEFYPSIVIGVEIRKNIF
tara:strand:- start:565 stop:972 length:408 start_codon:yes stop_codon:yes gene_type:complete